MNDINDDLDSIQGYSRTARPRLDLKKAALIVLASVFILINIAGISFILFSKKYISSNNAASLNKPPAFMFSFKGDEKQGLLARPLAVTIDDYGKIYVVDTGNKQIQVFDAKGKFLYKFGREKRVEASLNIPCYIAVSPSQRIYVSDRGINGILVYDKNGRFLRKFKPNNQERYEWSPLGMEFNDKGDLYVCDADSQRIRVFDISGKLKKEIGIAGQEGLKFPNDIALTKDKIYVSDSNNARVVVFKMNGQFLKALSMPKGVVMGLPRGIVRIDNGKILVADAISQVIHVFDNKDRYLYSFGLFGNRPSDFNFPNGLALGRDGKILVADRENNAIKVWGF